MGHRLRRRQRRADGVGGPLDDLAMKGPLEAAVVRHAQFTNDPLRREVATGGVVLVQGVHRHAVARSSRRLGQGVAKGILPFVGDADPVHGTEDHRLLCAEQDDAAAAERQFAQPQHGIVGHRRTDGRRRVHVEPSAQLRQLPVGDGFDLPEEPRCEQLLHQLRFVRDPERLAEGPAFQARALAVEGTHAHTVEAAGTLHDQRALARRLELLHGSACVGLVAEGPHLHPPAGRAG